MATPTFRRDSSLPYSPRLRFCQRCRRGLFCHQTDASNRRVLDSASPKNETNLRRSNGTFSIRGGLPQLTRLFCRTADHQQVTYLASAFDIAQDRNRTCTVLLPLGPEPSASASSATWAKAVERIVAEVGSGKVVRLIFGVAIVCQNDGGLMAISPTVFALCCCCCRQCRCCRRHRRRRHAGG